MSNVTAIKKAKVPTISSLIDSMADLRDQRRALEEQDKVLKAAYDELDTQLVATLKQQGLDGARGTGYTASISTSDQFSPSDWDVFMAKVVAKNKAWHLVQRRMSAPAMRELCELRGFNDAQLKELGVERFTKEVISLRKV